MNSEGLARKSDPEHDNAAEEGHKIMASGKMFPSSLRSPQRRTSGFQALFATGNGGVGPKRAEHDRLVVERWGPPTSQTHQLVMRYWAATRTQQHWQYLYEEHPRQFRQYLSEGYMEPIPTQLVQSGYLTQPCFSTTYETRGEKRLYYMLNNALLPDGSKATPIQPLNGSARTRQAYQRNALAVALDSSRLTAYASKADIFRLDPQTHNFDYSFQVPSIMQENRRIALGELSESLRDGDHLETMLLIDVSGSMLWDPRKGIRGPDGLKRKHDQPSNIKLVQQLVHRLLQHMILRARNEHPQQYGIDTVTFSDKGTYIGQLSTTNFSRDWATKVNLGGGTYIMRGWQTVKTTYFESMHKKHGHGYLHETFGWQWTPGMPKLSLLVFLDGEAADMDEFELELMGETWAYVTVALVGMENCPHHHAHAIELARVSRFNPHIAYVDVHGRVCERMFVEDLLKNVYPLDAPTNEEILRPEYDLVPDDVQFPVSTSKGLRRWLGQ